MRILKIGSLALLSAAILTACAKLPQTPANVGALPVEKLAQTDSIPADWGKLTSVTVSPDFPRQAQLWFQDEKGNIRLVTYDMPQNTLSPDSFVIHRD